MHFDDFYVFWRFWLQPNSFHIQPDDLALFSPFLVYWNTPEIILHMWNSCFEVGLKFSLWKWCIFALKSWKMRIFSEHENITKVTCQLQPKKCSKLRNLYGYKTWYDHIKVLQCYKYGLEHTIVRAEVYFANSKKCENHHFLHLATALQPIFSPIFKSSARR